MTQTIHRPPGPPNTMPPLPPNKKRWCDRQLTEQSNTNWEDTISGEEVPQHPRAHVQVSRAFGGSSYLFKIPDCPLLDAPQHAHLHMPLCFLALWSSAGALLGGLLAPLFFCCPVMMELTRAKSQNCSPSNCSAHRSRWLDVRTGCLEFRADKTVCSTADFGTGTLQGSGTEGWLHGTSGSQKTEFCTLALAAQRRP